MKKSLLILLVLLFVLGFSFNSFAAPKGTLRIATPDFAYESTDPIFWESFWGWAMYDPLLTFDPKGNAIGSVAESWKLSPDGKTWTFKIRKGMKFHNGDPVTSADVAFSVVRFSSKESTNPWSHYFTTNFESVETPDPYTFVYHSLKPEPPLIVPFGWTRILPKNYFEKVGQDGFRKAPIGSGPWKFVKWVSKTSFEMEANTKHWRQVPAFEKVIDLMVPEEATRVAMLKNGEVDIAVGLSYDRIVELKNLGFTLEEAGLPTLMNVSFQATWLTKGPTSDIRVRQAMSYAVNRQELCDTVYKGFGKPGGRWYMDENTYGWDPSWKPDPYDLNKVKALLKEAGYPDKFENPVINIFAQANQQMTLVEALAGYWDAAGIQTKINTVDPMTYGGYFFVRIKDANAPNVGSVIPWVFQGFFNTTYHCFNMYGSSGVHSTGNDPKADELYTKATTELDPVKAKKYWMEYQNYAYTMWVNVGICRVPTYMVVGPKVGKFTSNGHLSIYDALAGIQHK
jgi:peptide/nickel transport system substrate-binding protein